MESKATNFDEVPVQKQYHFAKLGKNSPFPNSGRKLLLSRIRESRIPTFGPSRDYNTTYSFILNATTRVAHTT